MDVLELHFDPIFAVIALVLFAGICLGWAMRELLAPPIKDRRTELPFVRVDPVRTPAQVLRDYQRLADRRPPAPPTPKFEEDAFFAGPDDRPRDVENVVQLRQIG